MMESSMMMNRIWYARTARNLLAHEFLNGQNWCSTSLALMQAEAWWPCFLSEQCLRQPQMCSWPLQAPKHRPAAKMSASQPVASMLVCMSCVSYV